MHCVNCNAKNVRKVLAKHFDSNHTIMLSREDKCVVKIGVTWCPLASFPKTKKGWVAESVEVIVVDHDTGVKYDLFPTITLDIDIPKSANLGNFWNGNVHVGVKDSAILPTSAVRKVMDIVRLQLKNSINLCFCLSTPTAEGIETIDLIECKHHACVWHKITIFKTLRAWRWAFWLNSQCLI